MLWLSNIVFVHNNIYEKDGDNGMLEKLSYAEALKYLLFRTGNKVYTAKDGKKIIILENKKGQIKAFFNEKSNWEKRKELTWFAY